MQFESIDIRDFRGIESTSAELAPLTVIRGANHKGKTSVAQAIQIGMTGRAKGTDAQGRGAIDKVRHGAKKAHIHLAIRGKSGTAPLGVTYGPGRTGRQVVTETPKSLLQFIDLNADRLSCTLDTDYFIRQKPDEQKSILASLVLPVKFDFPATIREQVKTHLGIEPAWDSNAAQLIEMLYSTAYDKRKEAKAALDGVHIPQLPQKPAHSVAQIKAKLEELRSRAKNLQLPAAASNAVEIARLENALRAARQGLASSENEAEDLRSAISQNESDILDNMDLKRYQRAADHRQEYTDLEAQSDEIGRQIEEQNQVAAIFTELLSEKTCPTCHQQMNEAFIKARIREAKETAANLGNEQREIMRKQKELGDIAGAEKILQAHHDALARKSNWQSELAQCVSDIADARLTIKSTEEELAALNGQTQPATDTTELDSVNAQIGRVEAELEPAIAYESAVATIEKESVRKRILADNVEALEKIVAYFGKDGVKAQLIKANIDHFQQSVNQVLSAWGYRATFSIEPYSFLVTLPTGATLPLKELSGSEEMMFAVALQTAIAHHSGIRCVVVDKADTFIDSERSRLFGCLNKLRLDNFLDQAIVMVADASTDAPKKEGVAYYAAQDGKLVRL